jgi:hypothetical protein
MTAEVFIPYKPHAATLRVVEQANGIIGEYEEQGFTLTLRQLFYQFVARALLENAFKEYKRLGVIVRDARDGGLIDWDAIEDRTREVHAHSFWGSPAGIISEDAHVYHEDLWAAFNTDAPKILGAVLDAVSHGLKTLPDIQSATLPRMADFAKWAMACKGAFWPKGTFEAAYTGNLAASVEETLAGDTVASAIRT